MQMLNNAKDPVAEALVSDSIQVDMDYGRYPDDWNLLIRSLYKNGFAPSATVTVLSLSMPGKSSQTLSSVFIIGNHFTLGTSIGLDSLP